MTDSTRIDSADPVSSVTRLAAVTATGLIGANAHEPILERLATVARNLVNAPLVLVSLLTAEEQWVVAASGSAVVSRPARHRAMTYSLCQHVIRGGAAVSVDDTTTHALMQDNLAVTELGIHSYLGVPLTTSAGETVGVLCAVDFAPRAWREQDRDGLLDLAAAATAHLEHLTVQAELRTVALQLSTIAQVSADGLWSRDMVANTAFHSPRFRELLGMTPDAEASIEAFMAVLHPDDVAMFTTSLQTHLTRRTPFEVQVRLWVGDSGYRWFVNRGQAVWDAAGTPTFMAGSLGDVTEQLRTAAALKVSEVHLAQVVDSAMDAVICTTPDGEIILFNQMAERMFGLEASHAIRRSLEELLPGWRHDAPGVVGEPPRALRTLTGLRTDGSEFPAEVTISDSVASDHAGVLATITVIVRDVTERTTLEAELRHAQKMDALGRMAGGIAHDFNNLLTVIRGSAELASAMLHAGQPARDVLPDVVQVVEAADRAAALTRQLLLFSRKQVLAPQRVCLDVVMNSLEPLLNRLLGAQVSITLHAESRPAVVVVDPSQLEQVLVNLAINARDAMPDGGSLTIRSAPVSRHELPATFAERLPTDRAFVLLTVADTGSGMDAHTQAQVFEPFFTTKAPGRGTGLGLAIVHGIVEQSGGVIWLTSHAGQGTIISIVLPTAPGQAASGTPTGTPAVEPEARGHVLLVEDDADVGALATRMLVRAGYDVARCDDGEAALLWCRADLARAARLYAVVSDVQMPRRDGVSLARMLAVEYPALPVLLMSGVDLVDDGVTQRPQAFLKKPFTSAQLTQQLAQAVSDARAAMSSGAAMSSEMF